MVLNLRYIIRLVGAFISRFRLVLITSIVVGILIFFSIRYILPTFFGHKEEVIGMTGRFGVNSLPSSVLILAGNGLTKIGNNGEAEADLASSWETTDNGKTWVFHIKNGVWQDGKKIVSTDLNYDFTDLTIDRPDSSTIVFKLQTEFSPFPVVISRPVFKKGLLGTGEWRVTNISLGGDFVQKLILVNKVGDKKIFKFFPSEERTKLAFKLGEVNTITEVFDPEPFLSWRNVKIAKKSDHNKFVAIFLNVQDKLLSDKSVRQALAYSIRKDFTEERAISPVSPDSWSYNPQVKPYNYDPEHTKQLLDSLGTDLKKQINMKLVTNSLLLGTSESIAKNWSDSGVKTSVQISSGIPTDFQAFLAIFDIPNDPDQYSLWHSSQTATNISHYKNPRIDKLLEDGRTTIDTAERKRIYLDFQRFLLEDSPAIFLYHPISYTITR